jgi:hypothetical protein
MDVQFSFTRFASLLSLKQLIFLLMGLTMPKAQAQIEYPPMVVIHLDADSSSYFHFGCSSYWQWPNTTYWNYLDVGIYSYSQVNYCSAVDSTITETYYTDMYVVPFDPDTLDVNALEVDSLYAICRKFIRYHEGLGDSYYYEGFTLRGSQSYMIPFGQQYFDCMLSNCPWEDEMESWNNESPYLADTTLAQTGVRFGIINSIYNTSGYDTTYIELGGVFNSGSWIPPTYQYANPTMQQWLDTVCYIHNKIYTYSIHYDDSDGDGWVDSLDCDPANEFCNASYPEELCDGIDNNCDGQWESLPFVNFVQVPDSLISTPNTMVLVNSSVNCISYEWNMDGVLSTDPYPTFFIPIEDSISHTLYLTGYGDYGCTDYVSSQFHFDSNGNMLAGGGMATVFTIQVIPPVAGIAETEQVALPASSWPNPFSHITTISSPFDRNRYRVYSMDGRTVMQGYASRSSFELDLSHEPEGMYLMLMEDTLGNSCTLRLIKD